MDQRYPTNRPGDDLEDLGQDEAIKAWIEFISQRDNLVEDLIKAEAERMAGLGYMPEGY